MLLTLGDLHAFSRNPTLKGTVYVQSMRALDSRRRAVGGAASGTVADILRRLERQRLGPIWRRHSERDGDRDEPKYQSVTLHDVGHAGELSVGAASAGYLRDQD